MAIEQEMPLPDTDINADFLMEDAMPSEDDFVPYDDANGDPLGMVEENPMERYNDLLTLIASDNIADLLEDDELQRIGMRVKDGVEVDEDSCQKWRKGVEEAMELANLESDDKAYPWPGASNVKYPLITNASMQFAARAYPEIVQGDKIVKVGVFGDDPDGVKEQQAERVTEFLTWQILEQIPDWEGGFDKLLHVLPNVGTLLRKVWFDEINGHPRVETLLPQDYVINFNTRNIKDARRITHVFYMYKNDVVERQKAGLWSDVDLGMPKYAGDAKGIDEEGGEASSSQASGDSNMFCFYEQHRWLDLDEDGYEEPYVVTVDKDSGKVVRIVARFNASDIQLDQEGGDILRIKARCYFIDYPFIPSQEGGFHAIGFGHLLYNLNMAINTILNQLIDSGTLANTQGGFKSRAARALQGDKAFKQGEWTTIDLEPEELQQAFFKLPTKEPSQTLFALLGMLMETGQSISQVTDVLQGQMSSPNASPTAVLAMIEQGMKVYSGIHKRIYRSLKCEIKKLMELDLQYLTPQLYTMVLDDEDQDQSAMVAEQQGLSAEGVLQDFDMSDFDIAPVADPMMATDMQKMMRAQILMPYANDPDFNGHEIKRRFLEEMKVPNVDQVLIDRSKMPPPPPDPLTLDLQRQTIKDRAEIEIKTLEGKYKAIETITKAIKNLADAEAAEAGTQMDKYRLQLESIANELTQVGDDERETNQIGISGPD